MSDFVKIRLIKSPIGKNPRHRRTLRALGLRKLNCVRKHSITPAVSGMIKQVEYLLNVEKIGEETK